MKQRMHWVERIMQGADLPEENPLRMPLVEICGDRRVLIENHAGVTQYTSETVAVRVRHGTISVCGAGLKLCHMSANQLIISGRIHSVVLNGGIV